VAARVLEDHETRKLVEFNSEVTGILKLKRRVRIIEWVTLDEPSSITFEGVSGPLPMLNDLIELDDHGGCTDLRYHSTIGAHGWWLGWPVAKWYAKPIVAKHIRDHTSEIKEAIETRARESRAFPQVACEHGLSHFVLAEEGR
jgi:hypothetical protein